MTICSLPNFNDNHRGEKQQSSGTLAIGASPSGAGSFNGYISQALFYSAALPLRAVQLLLAQTRDTGVSI
jgi:hypothetical protein